MKVTAAVKRMEFRTEIVVLSMYVVIQCAFFFGKRAINLAVIVGVRMLVAGFPAADEQHAIEQAEFSARDVCVHCRQICRNKANCLWGYYRPSLCRFAILC